MSVRQSAGERAAVRDGMRISGGIAQLGERLNGIQEVSGSIPLISTRKEKSLGTWLPGLFLCRVFGPVAQLGERSVRIREVESSNLFRSTSKKSVAATVTGFFPVCRRTVSLVVSLISA